MSYFLAGGALGGCDRLASVFQTPVSAISTSASVDCGIETVCFPYITGPSSEIDSVHKRPFLTLRRSMITAEIDHVEGSKSPLTIGWSWPSDVLTNIDRRSLSPMYCVSNKEASVSIRATTTVMLSWPPASLAMSTSRLAASRGVAPASVRRISAHRCTTESRLRRIARWVLGRKRPPTAGFPKNETRCG